MSLDEFILEYGWDFNPNNRWFKPDKVDFPFILILGVFAIVITYNFTLINIITFQYPQLNPIMFEIQKLVIKLMIIGLLGIFGICLKIVSNIIFAKKKEKVIDEETKKEKTIWVQVYYKDEKGNQIPLTTTRTTTEGLFSLREFGEVGLHLLLMFVINSFISVFFFGTALSFFNLSYNQYVVSIIVAVGEELLFTWGFETFFLPHIDGLTIPLVVFLFGVYHLSVYGGELSKLLFTAIARGVYSIDYVYGRRISSCCLAHILNNVIAYQGATPTLSIFQFLI